MADSAQARQSQPTSGGMGAPVDETKNMMLLNDLSYKLEPDMSVAVNKTHKNHFFQQTSYKNTQPAICILNSGSDYIDTRRSFLHFDVDLSCISRTNTDPESLNALLPLGNNIQSLHVSLMGRTGKDFQELINQTFIINGLFGENGSILNLIDTVTVTTRSGDELSRITDLALLSNMLLPLHHGQDWKETVGGLMGFGDALYGRNQHNAHALASRRYCIPMYLLSPLFAYGRLMPAMLMSGLRIQITWHTPARAFAQVVSRVPSPQGYGTAGTYPGTGQRMDSRPFVYNNGNVNDHFFESGSSLYLTGPYLPNVNQPLMPDPKINWWGTNAEWSSGRQVGGPNSTPGGCHSPGYNWKREPLDRYYRFVTQNIPSGQTAAWKGGLLNPEAVSSYTINAPEFSLCSIQLSDAIQRKLNEFSAVNGLEIVYTDFDLTTSPITSSINGTSVYTEVRKSASRALAAYARLVPTFSKQEVEIQADSNRSVIMFNEDIKSGGKGWTEYQWQLGSLYFPQQKVQGKTAFDLDPVAYAHTLEAVDRLHGKGSCFLALSVNGSASRSVDAQSTNLDYFRNLSASAPDTFSQERVYVTGQPGTFCGGGHVIAVSLERSSLFNLSGIPINNSRVLALRGTFSGVPTSYSNSFRLNIYLKFVKLARIFLNNVEVEQ